jgi:hypothetical protein
VRKSYTSFAIWFFTVTLVLVMVNVGLYVFWDTDSTSAIDVYGTSRLMKAYPGWSRADVRELLHESASIRVTYDVIRQLRMRPLGGRFLNIQPEGFRNIESQAPWPPDPKAENVFVFGGSTTFGFGLPDGQTIPSELQKAISQSHGGKAIHVYNFGMPVDTSTQEMLNYLSLVREGFIPDVAIFIDGLNDCIEWKGSWGFGDIISARVSHPVLAMIVDLPITLLARSMRRVVITTPGNAIGSADRDELSDGVIKRWMSNRKLIEHIAAAVGTRVVFVWQPVSSYKYDLKNHFLYGVRSAKGQFLKAALVSSVYPKIETLNELGKLGSDFLYLGDIQEGAKDNLYVDANHYNYKFCKEIAFRIGAFIRVQRLI